MATNNNAIPTNASLTANAPAAAPVVRKQEMTVQSGQTNANPAVDKKDPQSEKQKQAQLNKLVGQLNDNVQVASRKLTFSIDKESGRTIIKVIDGNTDKVIRQIPSEEMIALARSLKAAEVHIFSAKA